MRTALLNLACLLLTIVAAVGQTPSRQAFLLINTEYQSVAPLTANTAALEELKGALAAAKFWSNSASRSAVVVNDDIGYPVAKSISV